MYNERTSLQKTRKYPITTDTDSELGWKMRMRLLMLLLATVLPLFLLAYPMRLSFLAPTAVCWITALFATSFTRSLRRKPTTLKKKLRRGSLKVSMPPSISETGYTKNLVARHAQDVGTVTGKLAQSRRNGRFQYRKITIPRAIRVKRGDIEEEHASMIVICRFLDHCVVEQPQQSSEIEHKNSGETLGLEGTHKTFAVDYQDLTLQALLRLSICLSMMDDNIDYLQQYHCLLLREDFRQDLETVGIATDNEQCGLEELLDKILQMETVLNGVVEMERIVTEELRSKVQKRKAREELECEVRSCKRPRL